MKYWKQGFYDEPVEGGVEITDERWLELIDGQAAGMLITEDEQGSPVLTEYVNSVPVPTYEQRVQQRKNTTPEIYGSGAQSGQSLTTRWRGRLRIRHGSS